ncbi:hypothetical protein HWV62_6639 [Athelia sp. TMB]|nr:hypothetical protein HWV62_6639 [Athelia sp. TMB]
MEQCMGIYGRVFLEASIGAPLRRLCQEKVAIEIDPSRNNKGQKDLEKNVDLLITWCNEFWSQIFSVKDDCPPEMKQLLQHVRKLVMTKYQVTEHTEGRNRSLPWQGVSAFCFLRFIAPAMLNPHMFGLCPGRPPTTVQRSLTLVTKVIQSLANLNSTVGKEEYMKLVAPFLQSKLPEMKEYLNVVSTYVPSSAPTNDVKPHKDILNALRWRLRTKPALVREAVPSLPYLVDIPAQLASVAAAVIRGSRSDHYSRSPDPPDDQLDELLIRGGEIEATALQRVGQLASRTSDPPASPTSKRHSASPTITPRNRRTSTSKHPPSSHRPRRTSRPVTAPSQSDLSDTLGHEIPSDASLPSSPVSSGLSPLAKLLTRTSQVDLTGGQPSSPEDISARRRSDKLKARSTSTDSVPGSAQSQADFSWRAADSQNESDDQAKRKKGILKSILRR